jgi:hypothetical protein
LVVCVNMPCFVTLARTGGHADVGALAAVAALGAISATAAARRPTTAGAKALTTTAAAIPTARAASSGIAQDARGGVTAFGALFSTASTDNQQPNSKLAMATAEVTARSMPRRIP